MTNLNWAILVIICMTNLNWAILVIAIAIALTYIGTVSNPCSAMNENSCDADVARQF